MPLGDELVGRDLPLEARAEEEAKANEVVFPEESGLVERQESMPEVLTTPPPADEPHAVEPHAVEPHAVEPHAVEPHAVEEEDRAAGPETPQRQTVTSEER